MKIKINAGLASIQELTPDELDVIFGIVESVDKHCFPTSSRDEFSGLWFCKDGYVASLSDVQRSALKNLATRVRDIYDS